MSWMQSHDRRSRAKAPVERGRCCYAGSSEETIRVGLAEKGTATPWLMDRMRQLLLPVKLSARKKKLSVQERYHWMVLLLWVLSWSLFSLWILSSMSSGAIEMRREELASMCDERARMLEDQVKVSMNQLQALSILVSTFHHSKHPSAIDQMTFARYVERTAFERPLTSGLAYAVRVMHDKRELFEHQQEWSIKMMCSSKGMNISHALPAEEYAPVIFAQDAYKHVVSFDMLSGTEDRDNVLRARESGKAVLTAPFKLLNNRIGVILTYAVYKSELPPNATVQYRIRSAIGYLGAIFDIEAHVDKLLQKLAGKESIAVNVYDTTNKKPISMYGSNDTGSDWYNVCILNFGDPSRKHEMRCKFVQKPSWPWLAITSSFGTLVVSLLVGYIFHFTGKQTAKVEGTDVIQAIHGHEEVKELEPDKVVDQEVELNLRLEVEDKLNETQRNLEELGERSKFITMVKKLDYGNTHSLPAFRCLNKKIMIIILVGLVLYILIIGPFEQPFNLRLGMRRCMMLHNHKYGFARGRLLISTLHGPWAKPGVQVSDMIRVDLRKVTGNNDSSGHQKHWSSHNSSEIPAVLFVPWNGKEVKVRCNLIADEKALENWISNSNTVQSSKYQNKEAITEIQNGTVNPHLSAHISHKTMVGPLIALAAVIMLVLGTAVWFLLWCTHRRRVQQNELEIFGGMGPRPFERDELAAATSNFTDENKLGQGGFGPVYKGYLRDQDLHVAIKVLCRKQSSEEQSEQGLREFKAEVKVMTQLRHRNIVKLVGWCDSKNQLLLVYELMAQGSLDKHLYDPEKTLTWPQRFKIVLDLGSGLLYLHHDCEKCIVHGDIKPANVMLDVSHNAKLGDFGLARLIEHGGEPQTTQVVAGTPGYIDPEFINNRWPRTELDVYSFGVVLLEITCGKRPASRQPSGASSLLAWVHDLYDRGMVLNAADPRLNGEFDQRQMERVIITGLWCAHQDPIQRPSIMQAMDVLRCADAELPVLPAAHDARRIRFMEEQAYADLLPVEDPSAGAITRSRYFTSKDSVYLIAEE